MPIGKADGSVLRKIDMGFDIIPRAAIDNLETAEAIAIYTLLLTRPNNWVVRKKWVMDRLRLGHERYKKGVDELKSKGHWVTASVQDGDGKLGGRVIWFMAVSDDDFTEVYENRTSGNPDLRGNGIHKEQRLIKEQENNTLFDIFWTKYPRKAGKVAAKKSFTRLSKNKKECAIKDCETRFSNVKEKKFIPYPATYLNGERWEDEKEVSDDWNSLGYGPGML
ncbi:MAG: hypothetical protein DRP08_04610 [Candidatus Aenigmatarchaeota archaeon]|nr:MAG: hypothetical protein DRP08_04610 [Candidatus Aenigmarchaeota archaeon]